MKLSKIKGSYNLLRVSEVDAEEIIKAAAVDPASIQVFDKETKLIIFSVALTTGSSSLSKHGLAVNPDEIVDNSLIVQTPETTALGNNVLAVAGNKHLAAITKQVKKSLASFDEEADAIETI